MRVLVVHGSRMGSTAGIAERIAGQLRASGLTAVAVAAADKPDTSTWDAFVVGAGVYAGRWHKDAVEFVRDNRVRLATHPVWLFSSGPLGRTATEAAAASEPTPPKDVRELSKFVHLRGHRTFAGAFERANVDRAGLGAATRFIASRLIPEGDFRDWGEIEAWASEIAGQLRAASAVAAGAAR